ncbi:MAG: glycoside hydrolase family 2 protein [Bacteroidetes bacterium]|nr:glycoside hydrolase family 2 protein [Bacteroidota bacterium]
MRIHFMMTGRKFIFFCILLFISSAAFSQAQTKYLSGENNSAWQCRKQGDEKWRPANVPGTVHTDLLSNHLIDDPFYSDHEKKLQWIDTCNWEYATSFDCDSALFNSSHVELQFDGLDTYAKVFLNDVLILTADNMFRSWNVNCKSLLKENNNRLVIQFESAVRKGKTLAKNLPYTLPGDEKVFTRKAAYQYGWDWGPRFVTCGIWRPVKIVSWDFFRINDIHIIQDELADTAASLVAEVNVSADEATTVYFKMVLENDSRDSMYFEQPIRKGDNILNLPFKIRNPKRWWCNGLGEPFLYHLSVQSTNVFAKSETKNFEIGLRTLQLVQDADSIGRRFYFKLNGIPVFMKGANYIPADNFLPRVSENGYKEMIQSAADANMNMLRVWGGGIYEDDAFYKLCDENGILVWQDFMFACSMYPGDSLFLDNVKEEATQNVMRLRNHPCLALWCGNNEMDEGWKNWGWPKQYHYSEKDSAKIRNDYEKIFMDVLKGVVETNDGLRSYWPSSPSIGWGHDESLREGDSHYWGVWWGKEPFEMYQSKVGRFMSEYGFQGMPSLETFKKFCDAKDWSLTSAAVKNHQKHPTGYETIQSYLEKDYRQPKDFENYIYVSQLLQAEGMKTAIEAHRKSKPTCMGTLYWQLNDCWPVTSWSSMDYFGNWKALHYTVKKAFSKFLVTAEKKGENLVVYVSSDQPGNLSAKFKLKLIDFNGNILWGDSGNISVAYESAAKIYMIPLKEILTNVQPARVFLKMVVEKDKNVLTENLFYFTGPKNLMLDKTDIQYVFSKTKDNRQAVTVSSKTFAKNVFIDFGDANVKLSDNYFDLLPGEKKTITVQNSMSSEELARKIKIKSLIDSY